MQRELLVSAALFLVQGCGERAGAGGASASDPLSYLRVGVDPAAEAESSMLALARAGYVVETRLDGRAFVAIAGARRRDRATAVRVFTHRGAAIALDAPDPRFEDRRGVRLLAARAPFELDGAPGEEFAVELELATRRCIAIVQVREDGAAREVPLPLAGLPGSPCVERLADVAGDRRPELLATLRLDAAGLVPSPSVPFALGAEAGRHRPLPPALGRVFYGRERGAREEAAARATGEERLRLAVEVAALARLEGRDQAEAVEAFDRVAREVDGLEEQAREARAFVAGGFGFESGFPGEGVLDAPP